MSVNDKCGLPYTVVLDTEYEKLCPWSDAEISGKTWHEVDDLKTIQMVPTTINDSFGHLGGKSEAKKKEALEAATTTE